MPTARSKGGRSSLAKGYRRLFRSAERSFDFASSSEPFRASARRRRSSGSFLLAASSIAGAELDVVAAAPDFMSILATARSSAVIATVSSRIALRYGPLLGLDVSPVPLALSFPPVAMVWPLQMDSDLGCAWLRQQIREAMMRTNGSDLADIAA